MTTAPGAPPDLKQHMQRRGVEFLGYRRVRDPDTGELRPGRVALGLVYIHMLDHQPEAKKHARGLESGHRTIITGGPIKVRSCAPYKPGLCFAPFAFSFSFLVFPRKRLFYRAEEGEVDSVRDSWKSKSTRAAGASMPSSA